MPKQKSHSGAKKRFHVTGTGKIARNKAYKGHLNAHKSGSTKRRHAGKGLLREALVVFTR